MFYVLQQQRRQFYEARMGRGLKPLRFRFDHDGANISDADLKKAKITLKYTGSKPASYKGTDAEKEAHRKKSARYRASPGYVRPDKGKTVRAQVARTYKIPTKKIDNNKDVL